MYINRMLLAALLFSEIVFAKSSGSHKSWVSGVQSLDTIEQAARLTACDLCCELFLEAWDVELSQKQLDKVLKKVAQDKHRTVFSKKIAEVSDSYFEKHIKSSKSYQQIVSNLTVEYFPEKIDLVQVCIDYSCWGYEYLIGRLHKKSALTVEDVCYVMEQMPYYMRKQLSLTSLYALKPSYDMWMALVKAVEKGLKGQSTDVQQYFIKNIENFVQDKELKNCIESLESINKSRQEIIKKSSKKGVDTATLDAYQKSVDALVACMKKLLGKHVDKKNKSSQLVVMIDKLLVI